MNDSDATENESDLQVPGPSDQKTRFLAEVSHEIRTPLTGIIGALSLLRNPASPEQHRRYLRIAEDSANALLDTLNDILDLTKFDAEDTTVRAEPFDVYQLVGGALELMAARAAQKRLGITSYIDVAVPRLLIADVTRIRQILLNLVSNAVRYTDHGAIIVRCALRDGEDSDQPILHLVVEDTGVGISEAMMPELFQEYRQLDDSFRRQHGGTGLGLSIVRRLVAMLGGDISCDSELGRGTRFDVLLPVARDLEGTSQFLETRKLGGRRFAVSAGHPLLTRGLVAQLRSWGGNVLHYDAAAGRRAAWLARSTESSIFDLVVCDVAAYHEALDAGHALDSCPLIVLGELAGDAIEPRRQGFASLSGPVTVDALYKSVLGLLSDGRDDFPEARDPHAGRAPVSRRSGRILLAEDSPVNQIVAGDIMRQAGYTVDIAGNGVEVLDRLRAASYDGVLMDMRMPTMDGLEATCRIHEMMEPGTVPPIIAMTADVSAADRRACLEAGMVDFVSKPFRPEALLDALAAHVREARATPGADEAAVLHEDAVARLEASLSPAAFRQAIVLFLKELDGRLVDMLRSERSDDYDHIALNAHALKSMARSFGAARLADASDALQAASAAAMPLDVRKLLAEVETAAIDVSRSLNELLGVGASSVS